MKKLISVLLVVVMSSFVTTSFAATDEDWRPTPPPSQEASWGIVAQGVTATYTYFASPSLMSFKAADYQFGISKVLDVHKCALFGGSDCPSDQFQKYHSPMGYCNQEVKTDCVSDVLAYDKAGTQLPVNYVGPFGGDPSWSFIGDPLLNLPTSGQSFLVDIPGAPHIGGTKYLISSVLDGFKYPTDTQFKTNGFQATIWPVNIVDGAFLPASESLVPNAYSALGINAGSGGACSGVQSEVGRCAVSVAAPLDVSIGLRMKFATKIDPWLHGRISNVQAQVVNDEANNQIVTIVGNPVRVPTIFGWVTKSSAPQQLTDFYKSMDPFLLNMGNGYGNCLDPSLSQGACNPKFWESILRGPFNDSNGFSELSIWLPIVKNTAAAAPTSWTIRSMSGDFSGCPNPNHLIGFVNTNSTLYMPGPPTFNQATQTLDYQVLSTHNLPDGSAFQGTYDLLIDSALARCIYHFSSAPIKATVSVISSDGIQQSVTTAVTERDGFIHMGAYGFTFSSPTISVKLSQDEPATTPITPEIPALPAVSPKAKKITITCIKGKLVRKMTGSNPKCPSGFKKKTI